MKRPLTIMIACAALGAAQMPGAAAETFQVDWENVAPSLPPLDRLDGELRVRFTAAQNSMFVDASTTPPNPFPGIKNSLRVFQDDPESSWFRQRIRILETASTERGTFQMEFRLIKGQVRLQVGVNELPWDGANVDSYLITGSSYVNVSFSPGNNVVIQGSSLRTDTIEQLDAAENYVFSVKWDLTVSPPVYTFFLNDEPLLPLSGVQPFSLKAKPDAATQGVNAVRISLGSSGHPEGEFFLGKISASSEE